MLRLLIRLSELLSTPLAITPAERWRAARPTSFGSNQTGSPYVIVMAVLGAIALTAVALLLHRWLAGRGAGQPEFSEQAERAGLGKEETNLLAYAAKLGRLRTSTNLVAVEAVFYKCMRLLMRCERVLGMSPADKQKILSVINSAQIKLGFESSETVDIRRIPESAIVTLTAKGISEPIQTSIVSTQGWEIKTQANGEPPLLKPGMPVRGRYCQEGSVWEFQAELIYAEGRDLTLSHAENIRFINRRRFRRVKIDAPASLAPFPFLATGPHERPVFHPARLVELGANGLVLQVEDFPSVPANSHLLVLIEPRPEKSISAIGRALRTKTITSRQSRVVVELAGLSESELSELVSETNLAIERDATAEIIEGESNLDEPADNDLTEPVENGSANAESTAPEPTREEPVTAVTAKTATQLA